MRHVKGTDLSAVPLAIFVSPAAEAIWPLTAQPCLVHGLNLNSPQTPYLLYLNGSDGEGYFAPPIDIGVEYSQNVLELLRDH